MRLGIVAGLCIMVWHQSLLAADIEPLKNGYSAATPQTAALMQPEAVAEEPPMTFVSTESPAEAPLPMEKVEPLADESRLSVKLEKGADKILSSEDGVSAALGAALTATVSSNPAAVLVGGLAGIWAGDQRFSYCGCESMELGEKASSLFRTVSKTFFKGGRAIVDGSKKLVDKTGKNINKLRYANAPLPLKGQEPKIKEEVTDKPVVKKSETSPPKKMAAAPASVMPKPKTMKPAEKKILPPVITGTKKPMPLAKETPVKKEKQVAKKEPVKQKTQKPAAVAQVKKKPVEKPKLVTMKKEDTVLRANTKKLKPMPKLVVAETLPEPELSQEEAKPWPEQDFQQPKDEPTVHRVLKAQMESSEPSSFQAYTPPADVEQKMAANVQQAVDCDGAGGKVSRGRLAWMECYYRMDEE